MQQRKFGGIMIPVMHYAFGNSRMGPEIISVCQRTGEAVIRLRVEVYYVYYKRLSGPWYKNLANHVYHSIFYHSYVVWLSWNNMMDLKHSHVYSACTMRYIDVYDALVVVPSGLLSKHFQWGSVQRRIIKSNYILILFAMSTLFYTKRELFWA